MCGKWRCRLLGVYKNGVFGFVRCETLESPTRAAFMSS